MGRGKARGDGATMPVLFLLRPLGHRWARVFSSPRGRRLRPQPRPALPRFGAMQDFTMVRSWAQTRDAIGRGFDRFLLGSDVSLGELESEFVVTDFFLVCLELLF